MNDKLAGALSLCRKAGRLVMGADAASEAAKTGKAVLMLLTQDLSDRSAREMRRVCDGAKVRVCTLPCTMEDLYQYAGRRCGIYAVCDGGFARMIREKLPEEPSGNL